MKSWRTIGKTALYSGLSLVLVLGLFWQQLGELIVWEYWTREHPLANPVSVRAVRNGEVVLQDGRSFRPAGVVRRDDVTPEEYDKAISAVVAQGILVSRDFGDGRAFLVAEPKFYNWCGTHDAFRHWAGTYIQCPVSETLVHLGYASVYLGEAGLSPQERWRLEGIATLYGPSDAPVRVSESNSFRFDASMWQLQDLDARLEVIWRPAPH